VIDPDGAEWLPYSEAAVVVAIPVGTLKVWVHRKRVRAVRLGRVAYAHMGDVRHAEAAQAQRVASVRPSV
jgi:excisionase family DNA binding protein